ncbi:DUF7284 family protein [Halorarum halobium]|uniref:DUF7284 family protein n=1 Tax=Halorarum halobium TaxID=3075121 RepID=UPI0028A62673|nr:hypothetical protein [Halobaculum sp. XH14]
MTATALDAGLCLLLVSAAALTVVGARDPPVPEGRADAAAETLSVTTANVSYTLQPGSGDTASSSAASGELDRVAHGTLAELLARAAFRSVRIDGESLTNASGGFRRAVHRAVLNSLPARTRVDARWEPYPGSHVHGGVAVGPAPPGDRAVDAARLTVPVRVQPSAAGGTTTDTVGATDREDRLAGFLVRALFPPEQLRFALQDDSPLPGLVEHRYRRAGRLYGIDTLDALRAGGPAAANDRLRPAVADRIHADRREGSSDGRSATSIERSRRVVIVVRTWAP